MSIILLLYEEREETGTVVYIFRAIFSVCTQFVLFFFLRRADSTLKSLDADRLSYLTCVNISFGDVDVDVDVMFTALQPPSAFLFWFYQQAGEVMRDFFDRTKLFWTTEIVRRRERTVEAVEHMTEKVSDDYFQSFFFTATAVAYCCMAPLLDQRAGVH